MIDFIISRNTSNNSDFHLNHQLNNNYNLHCKKVDYIIEDESRKLIIIGDCINITDFNIKHDGIAELTNNLKGNFYAFLSDRQNLYITSSAFGLLPVYYLNDFSILSSSVRMIKKQVMGRMKLTENKKWLINQLLFNYQFGTQTFFEEIELFPSMSYLLISNNENRFIKYYDVRDELLSQPLVWKKALTELSEEVIRLFGLYIPDNSAVISFTGGFDGRTLVSIATNLHRNFVTFSYGKLSNDDVYIPKANAENLGIPYFWINLDEDYLSRDYYKSATEFIQNTDGANGFLYAHVDYLALKVKEKGDILISGVCGSELFRSVHATGAVTSKALIDLFREDDFKKYKEKIFNSESFRYINIKEYHEEIEFIIEETWKYKLDLLKKMGKNKALYVFIIEEVFRKFFGPWVKTQMSQLPVRTPYIDFQFFKKVIKTELLGAYSDFMTDNPLKRYKGQVLYSEVIRRTNTRMYWTKTGKGYSPAIVNNSILRPLLFFPFISKRLKRKLLSTDFDNLGIISGIKNSIPFLLSLTHSNFYNELLIDDLKSLRNIDEESYRDTILMMYSIIIYKNNMGYE